MVKQVVDIFEWKNSRGGEGSGNFGHEGRPGEQGGSGGGGGEHPGRNGAVFSDDTFKKIVEVPDFHVDYFDVKTNDLKNLQLQVNKKWMTAQGKEKKDWGWKWSVIKEELKNRRPLTDTELQAEKDASNANWLKETVNWDKTHK